MRPLRGSFERLSSFESLWRASRLARRSKRRNPATAAFEHDLERALLQLQEELRSGGFRFAGYRCFTIHEPTVREIRAAPYRDRVVHHAVAAELEPVIDRLMIEDAFACRIGKGSHRALDRLQRFVRGGGWVVKIDVRKYFYTIDHGELTSMVTRLFRDVRLERLLVQLLATYDAGPEFAFGAASSCDTERLRPRGLPIGNLTSQIFANYYLTPVDRFIKERIRARCYLRYMDDLVLIAPDRVTAQGWLHAIGDQLMALRLTPHPRKTQIFPVSNGVRFLGFRVYPYHRRILRENLRRFTRRMWVYKSRVERGTMDEVSIRRSLDAWLGYAGAGSSEVLVSQVLGSLGLARPGDRGGKAGSRRDRRRGRTTGSGRIVESSVAGRLVEQQREQLTVGQPEQQHSG